MPTKGTIATSNKKKRVAIKDLPAANKRVSAKEMKKVKGGGVIVAGVCDVRGGIILCKTNQGGIIIQKTGKG